MATYSFETITDAQALSFQTGDVLQFQSGPATLAGIAYSPGASAEADRIVITLGGRSVAFTGAVAAASQTGGLKFPDASMLYIGDGGANDRRLAESDPAAAAMFGGSGNDTLQAGAGSGLLQGNQGADSLTAGVGSNTVYGGQDNDTIVIVAGGGRNFLQGNKGTDTVTGGAGADTLLGGQDDDRLIGGGGTDFLNGNLGHDYLTGSGQLFGEAGADTLEAAAYGTNVLNGGPDFDVLVSLRDFPDGNGGSNTMYGEAGNDRITARGGGHDEMYGGDGADTIVNESAGADILDGGEGDDSLTGAIDFGDNIRGGDGADWIKDQGGANTIDGGSGDDLMFLSDGDGTIAGGVGDDTIYAEWYGDKLINGGEGADEIRGGRGHDTINGDAGDDGIYASYGSNRFNGGDGNDGIYTRSIDGQNTLDGGSGMDRLWGGPSIDWLIGGPGVDHFRISGGESSKTAGRSDRIMDWSSTETLSVGTQLYDNSYYRELAAPDYASALSQASSLLQTQYISIVVAEVGGDTFVFAGRGVTNAVMLVGCSLNDIASSNFVYEN